MADCERARDSEGHGNRSENDSNEGNNNPEYGQDDTLTDEKTGIEPNPDDVTTAEQESNSGSDVQSRQCHIWRRHLVLALGQHKSGQRQEG